VDAETMVKRLLSRPLRTEVEPEAAA
jgi:hypothetical protein